MVPLLGVFETVGLYMGKIVTRVVQSDSKGGEKIKVERG